jgi:hypothetical protein
MSGLTGGTPSGGLAFGNPHSDALAIAEAVAAGHAAAFAAAVEDLRQVVDAEVVAIRADREARSAPRRPQANATAAAAKGPKAAAAAAATAGGSGGSVRGISLLFPREEEEVSALKTLQRSVLTAAMTGAVRARSRGQRRARRQAAHAADSDESDDSDADSVNLRSLASSFASLRVASDAPGAAGRTGTSAAAAAKNDGHDAAEASASAADSEPVPVSAAYVRFQRRRERVAVFRSYRLAFLLCNGAPLADEILMQRTEQVLLSMLEVFTARSKGSFRHACLVLQRLIQLHPDPVLAVLSRDSQRYIGSLLPYLHHPPVADTLLRLVLANHSLSAQGTARPIYPSGPAQNPMAAMFGLQQDPSRMLPIYQVPGAAASQRWKHNLWKNLASWGFLGVLASHVYRPEYAVCPAHMAAAADAFGVLTQTLATDAAAEPLFAPFAKPSRLLRGLAQGACWPVAGVDFPRVGRPLPGNIGIDAGYCRSGDGPGPGCWHSAAGRVVTVPARQQECMRMLRLLLGLTTTATLEVPIEPLQMTPAGQPTIQQFRSVANRLAEAQGESILHAFVAMLPSVAQALVRAHQAINPDRPLQRTPPPTAAGPGIVPARPSAASDLSGSLALASPGSGSIPGDLLSSESTTTKKKKKNKKNKKDKKKVAASSTSSAAGSVSGAGEEEDDDEDDADTVATEGPHSPLPSAARIHAAGSAAEDGSGAAGSLVPVTGNASAGSKASPNGPGALYAAAGGAAGAFAHASRHPGHQYTAPFGQFRLQATQMIAILLSTDTMIQRPELAPSPPLPPLPSEGLLSPMSPAESSVGFRTPMSALAAFSPAPTPSSASRLGLGVDADELLGVTGRLAGLDLEGIADLEDEEEEEVAAGDSDDDSEAEHATGKKGGKGKGKGGKKAKGKAKSKAKSAKGKKAVPDYEEITYSKASVAAFEQLAHPAWVNAAPARGTRQRGGKGASSIKAARAPSSSVSKASVAASPVAAATETDAAPTPSSSAPVALAHGSGFVLAPGHSLPCVYDPLEFWTALMTWALHYAHTNLYHVAFYDIVLVALRQANENALRTMFQQGRLLARFISHFKASEPIAPPVGKAARLESGWIVDDDRKLSVTARARKSVENSSARGLILRVLNAVRLVSHAQPAASFLPSFLREHPLWNEFLPRLKKETTAMLAVQVPPPSKPPAPAGIAGMSPIYQAILNQLQLSSMMPSHRDKQPDATDSELGSAFAKELGLEGLSRHPDFGGGKNAAHGKSHGTKGAATSGAGAHYGSTYQSSADTMEDLFSSFGGGGGAGKKKGASKKKGSNKDNDHGMSALDMAVTSSVDMLAVD